MGMVQLSVRLTAGAGRAHDLLEALRSLMRHSRRLRGCSDAHIAADVEQANAYWYWEDWDVVEALEAEVRNERFSQLLALMETSEHPPVLEFRVIAETRGLEYVKAAREAGGDAPRARG
jgi:quinol monooxygenase YgiN